MKKLDIEDGRSPHLEWNAHLHSSTKFREGDFYRRSPHSEWNAHLLPFIIFKDDFAIVAVPTRNGMLTYTQEWVVLIVRNIRRSPHSEWNAHLLSILH